jgi:hypothetical protein
MFAGVLGQLFEAEIINDQKFWIKIAAQSPVVLVESFILHEVTYQIEDECPATTPDGTSDQGR